MPVEPAPTAAVAPAARFWSTDQVPLRDRDGYWRDAVLRTYAGLTIAERLGDGLAHGRLRARPFAGGWMSECRQSQVRLVRDQTLALRGGGDHYSLILQVNGTGCIRHAGRTCMRSPGDMVLIDPMLRYDGTFPSAPHVRVWTLPRQMLGPMLTAPERSIGVAIAGAQGVGALLSAMLRALWREADRLDLGAQHAVLDSLCRLLALSLGATPEADEGSRDACRYARLQRGFAYIESRLADPALTANATARHLRIARRTLDQLFEEAGVGGPAAWITRRRIAQARARLEDPARRRQPIAEIAFECGFGDVSTFNRRFRQHCGMTPREAQAARIRPDAAKIDPPKAGRAVDPPPSKWSAHEVCLMAARRADQMARTRHK